MAHGIIVKKEGERGRRGKRERINRNGILKLS